MTREQIIEEIKQEWWDNQDGDDQQQMIEDYKINTEEN